MISSSARSNNTRNVIAAGLAVLLASVACAQPSEATTYDPAITFEAGWISHSNPNGVWSYGYSSTLGGSVTLFTSQIAGADSANQQMWIAPTVNCCVASPSIGFNNGPAFDDGNVSQAADQIDMVSSVSQDLVTDLVFTAPVSGNYSLTSAFIGDQRRIGVGVDVLKNGMTIFSSTVNSFGQAVSFDTSFALAAGDTVTFAVTQDGGTQNTGLDVSLTTTPLPAALPLFATALGGLGLFGWRRKRKARGVAA